MVNIRLTSMRIDNFKGIKSLEVVFGERARITGGNGVGKSSIMNAYLWCLFGQTTNTKSSTVQPLDKNNQVMHKLTTSVALTLSVNGQIIAIKKELSEKWSTPRGTSEESLTGTETTYYWNDVPCKMSEFKSKIDAICPSDDWAMVSNISVFNRLKQADKRKKLNAIAGEIDDKDVAKEYPCVLEALNAGKTIEEFKREVAAKKKKSKIDLDEIPARIDQQEKLRVDLDFDALKRSANVFETQIQAIDNKLQATVSKRISELSSQMQDIELSLQRERNRKKSELECSLDTLRLSRTKLSSKIYSDKSDLQDALKEKKVKEAEFESLKQQWTSINDEQFESNVEPVCPTCKRPYTERELNEIKDTLIERFNIDKISRLNAIEKSASDCKMSIGTLDEAATKLYNGVTSQEGELKSIDDKINESEKAIQAIPTVELALVAHQEYNALKDERDALVKSLEGIADQRTDTSELQSKKNALKEKLKNVNADLAKEGINERIDSLKKELEKQGVVLAQAVSEMDKIEYQIQQFSKRKIEMVEEAVSSLFSIVKWKFFDRNLTNDGETEICEAIVNGVPYSDDDLNQGASINAGIDICNAFSKAYGISAPLFVDCCESVESLIDTGSQLITLEVVKGQTTLNIN